MDKFFILEGKKFFTFGGATSVDKANRTEFISWWKEEMPTGAEFELGFVNLEKHNWKVDYIITHDCSNITLKELYEYSIGLQLYTDSLKDYFDIIEKRLVINNGILVIITIMEILMINILYYIERLYLYNGKNCK